MGSATTLRAFNGWATILWAVVAFPAIIWWRDSVPFLVGVSVYANLAGHLSAWQAARVEAKQDEAAS
jgi:hypothetical protein